MADHDGRSAAGRIYLYPAVDRLASTAHELVTEGESHRRRQKPFIHRTSGVSIDDEKEDQP